MSQPSFFQADGARLVVGRGAVTFDRFNASNAKVGAAFLGNVELLELSPTVEYVEKRGFVDNSNPLLARVESSRTLEVNLTLGEYKRFNLALALFGVDSAFTQTNAAVVGEVLVSAPNGGSIQGRIYYTTKRKITAVTLKDDAVAVANNVANYVVDAESGAIYITPGGTVADGSVLTVDYTPTTFVAADGLDLVTLGNAGSILGELRFVGDPVNGKIQELSLWKVQISPAGAVGLITEDFAGYPLKGTVLSDAVNHASAPYGQLVQRA